MDNNNKTSKSADTKASYKRRVAALLKRYQQETGRTDLAGLVDALIVRKNHTEISRNTWFQYKSALMDHLEDSPDPEHQALLNRLQNEPATGAKPHGSPGKTKSMTLKAVNYLILALEDHAHEKTRQRIRAFFAASHATGLRPGEWEHAHLESLNGKHLLHVINAKHTNERAHGDRRHMEILGKPNVRYVRNHLRLMQEFLEESDGITGARSGGPSRPRTYGDYYEVLRLALNRVYREARKKEAARGRKTWPPRLSLYSARTSSRTMPGKPDSPLSRLPT